MMGATFEQKKEQAIKRMKKIGVYPDVIKQFEQDDLVNSTVGPLGACYWLNDEQKQRVKQFEEKNKALVYHVIVNKASYPIEIGPVGGPIETIPVPAYNYENYLFVSDYPEEWEMDMDDLDGGQCLAYVNNMDDPVLSEIGVIGIRLGPAAGIMRTW